MNKSLKAALLSGLVFPGLGQVILKYYKRGMVFILAVSVSLLLITAKVLEQATTILEKLAEQGDMIDVDIISNVVHQTISSSDTLIYNLLFIIIFLCWILSIVDAYRLGQRDFTIDEPEYQSTKVGEK